MDREKGKVTEFPAPAPGQVAVPPELLIFAAMFDAAPVEPGKPRRLHFLLGPSLAAETMTAPQIYQILGELRTQIRKSAAENGNAALADAL